MFGFHGACWRFDCTTGRGEREALPERVLRAYLGGVGLGSWLLAREAPSDTDPLAPEALLVFAFAPLVGTPLTTSAKLAVVARSPLLVGPRGPAAHFPTSSRRARISDSSPVS